MDTVYVRGNKQINFKYTPEARGGIGAFWRIPETKR